MSVGSIAFGPVRRQHTMVGVCDEAEPVTSWPGTKERR
jgi:hypothetical protein